MAIATDVFQRKATLARATAVLDAVQDDPHRALVAARGLLDEQLDPTSRATALWAVGQAHRELNQIADAGAALRLGVDVAEEGDDDETAARIRISLSLALFTSGAKDEAFRQLDAATERLTGSEHGRCLLQRGLLLFQLGQLDEAVDSFDAALPELQAGGDRLAEARLRVNRAAAATTLGRLRSAELDLLVVQKLADELGQRLIAAGAQHNLGFVASRRGDVPTALCWYDRAQASYQELTDPQRLVAVLDQDRAEVLLAAGLSGEAAQAAARAVEAHRRDGNETDLAEAELLLASAQLASRRFIEAATVAATSATRFSRSHRRAWAALASYVGIQAQVLDPATVDHGSRMLDQTVALAAELDQLGWRTEALHVRSFAARIALGGGNVEGAREQLALAAAARHQGPAGQRVQAWYATALLRHLEGNGAGAWRALDAGLRLVDEARSGLGSSELRASLAHHGSDLTALGLRLALLQARPRGVLAWLERCRALAMLAPAVRPPDDEQFAAELVDLRQARNEVRERIVAGQPASDAQRRIVEIERSVRDRARQAQGRGALSTRITEGPAVSGLDGDVLVEYLRTDGQLLALVAREGRVTRHDLGPVDGLDDDLEFLEFALHRLARNQGSATSRALAAHTLDEVGSRVGRRLFGPLARRLGDRAAVIVPDPLLHRVPWALLPALRRRSFSVSPSLRVHVQARRAASSKGAGEVLLVAGPGLAGAAEEVDALRRLYPAAVALTGDDATAAAVCDALGRAQVAHLACHGSVRTDNPLFSSLTMADGDLTVYDLERCASVPRTVVLSACSTGAGTAITGTEVLGLSTALLSLGCGAVIAPMATVSDAATTPVMVALHQGLRRGERPATALAGAAPDPSRTWEERASWMAFATFGAG